MKKRRMTVAECKAQHPEAFLDADGKPDKRIKDNEARIITHMINEGESPFDAKLKTLNIAKPPDHFERVDSTDQFPKMYYHEDGKQTKVVEDEDDLAAISKKKEWSAKPNEKHLERLQRGTTPRDENIKRLQRELAAELKKKEEEQPETAAA